VANNTGVYICSGCEIGEATDVEALRQVALKEFRVPVCKTHPILCSAEGVNMLKGDLDEGIDRLVLAACSHRYHEDTFDFGKEVVVERAPLREYVAWTQPHQEEDTQMLASDYIRMHTTAVQMKKPARPFEQNTEESLLVVGGGVTGMTAALESARAGYAVHLVEKEDRLGGFARKLHRRTPSRSPFNLTESPDLDELIHEVKSHPRITLYMSSTIAAIAGAPGDFSVRLNVDGSAEKSLRAGAVVLASGGKPYDASRLTHLGSGYDNVITSVEFEQMAASGKIVRKDGQEANSVVFIQCAGSRDPDHLPYCSSFCCSVSLKQAEYVRESGADKKAYVIYRDMITPGQYENFYRARQNDPGIFLTKGDVSGVHENPDKTVTVDVDDSLLGERVAIAADLVVLAIGIEASTRDDPSLNLQSRQGPGLPDQKYGFPDSHFICFPYETRRTGIFTAGAVHQPMDMNFSRKDAAGAALKAIQTIELTKLGKTLHPRVGDETYPVFRLAQCTQCKRCTEECPFGVLEEDERGTPSIHEARCRGCGVCMGACPVRIISFRDYSVDIIGDMIKSIEIPDEFEGKPRILIFACENDTVPALDMMALERIRYSPYVRIVSLRCLGGVNLVWVSDALSRGFDGVMFMGCKFGDDYQCHFVKGSELANVRLSKVEETLGRLQLEPERVRQYEVSMNDYRRVAELIETFAADIEDFGPNPFKGM
jgi:quinone-modifying oxidoreductase subunit QmoB